MPKNIVFFVHGIGQHQAGWSHAPDGPISALNTAMRLYPDCFPTGKTLEDYLDLVEIRYDDIFDKVLERWKELGSTIPANSGFGWVNAVRDLMTSVGGNKELFLRYGGDVLLYCGFELVARTVRLRLNSVIATRIYQAYLASSVNPPKFSVIAHSLGTTVAQDALYQLATANWLGETKALPSLAPDLTSNPHATAEEKSHFHELLVGAEQNPDRPIPARLDWLFLISNTIPLLRRTGEYAMHKTSAGRFSCKTVVNVNHHWDPVSRICGGVPPAPPRKDWNDITVRHVHDKNIHGFGHYLANPAVHGPLFYLLIETGFTGQCYGNAKALALEKEWQGFGGPLANLPQQAREALQNKLLDMSAGSGPREGLLRSAIERLMGNI